MAGGKKLMHDRKVGGRSGGKRGENSIDRDLSSAKEKGCQSGPTSDFKKMEENTYRGALGKTPSLGQRVRGETDLGGEGKCL